MYQGKVKFYNPEKKFGFICDSDSGKDIFVHKSGLVANIKKDDIVNYDLGESQKGPCAINVTLA